MAATTTETHETHQGQDAHGDHHPRDGFYFKVAGILAVITALEVAASYVGLNTTGLMVALIPMMIAKFAIVAALFMHLRGDHKLFTRLFVMGIVLAFVIYGIVFFAFDEFF